MNTLTKLIFVVAMTVGCSFAAFAQDMLILHSGDIIESKVEEIQLDVIKYKKSSNLTGPTYTIKKSEVFIIKYENGTKDVITQKPSADDGAAKKAEEEKLAEEASKKEEANRIVEEAKKEAAKIAEDARKKEEASRIVEDAKKEAAKITEDARKKEEANHIIEDAKKEAAKIAEDARKQAEAVRLAEEAGKKAAEDKIAEDAQRKAENERIAKEAVERAELERMATANVVKEDEPKEDDKAKDFSAVVVCLSLPTGDFRSEIAFTEPNGLATSAKPGFGMALISDNTKFFNPAVGLNYSFMGFYQESAFFNKLNAAGNASIIPYLGGGFFLGPALTIGNKDVALDLYGTGGVFAMAGPQVVQTTTNATMTLACAVDVTFGLRAGANVRINLSDEFGLVLKGEFLYSNPEFKYTYEVRSSPNNVLIETSSYTTQQEATSIIFGAGFVFY